jgi:signal transduction histidine kinase
MSIRTKFFLSFGTIFVLVTLVAGIILSNLSSISNEFQNLKDTESRLTALADDIRYYDVTLTDAVRAYLIDPKDQAAYDQYYADAAALDQALIEAQEIAKTSEDRQIFENINTVNIELVEIEEQLLASPDLEAAVALYRGRYGELKAEYSSNVEVFFDRQHTRLQIRESLIASQLQQSLLLGVVMILILLGMSIGISILLSRDILPRLSEMSKTTARLAEGDLNARLMVTSHDELGHLAATFNDMAERQARHIKDLEIARREAEEATRMKDMFLATMSHELRTPLNAMIGFLHLMIYSGQMDDDNVHMAERSLANTQRLLTLINNILDLSRIATGGLEIVPDTLSPRYLASGLYNDLKVLAQDKGLRLELTVDQTLPDKINHDEARISQIVTNLVGNAIKFTDSGVVHLDFNRRDDRLVIQVTDTGVGIPQSKHHLIFDDFFQVDGTSTRKQQGAGLGLAIVKRLVLLMKGNIHLTSEVDKGSTFTVELPLNLPAYESPDRRRQADSVFASTKALKDVSSNLVMQGS